MPQFSFTNILGQCYSGSKTTLETSGEDVKTTLETSGEDVGSTLETSGEDVKLHSKRV